MKKVVLPLLFALGAVAEPVGSILFNNNTDVSLTTSIAGQRGRDIEPHAKDFPVPYFYLGNICSMGGAYDNCPIEFFSRTGELAARVRVNVDTGTILGTPELLGSFATGYVVSGWQDVPVRVIHINKS